MPSTRTYANLAGVDFSNKDVAINRSPYAVNMWKNYDDENGKCVETRPGMKLLGQFDNDIFGIFFFDLITSGTKTTQVIIHSGTKLFKWSNYPTMPVVKTELFSGLMPNESKAFISNNVLFIMDGLNYLEYNGSAVTNVIGTIPTTTIGKTPLGTGTTFQRVNVLQPLRKNSFVADGTKEYQLDTTELDPSSVYLMQAIVNDNTILVEPADFTVDRLNGKVTFVNGPAKPLTEGEDNVIIFLSKTVLGYDERVKRCTLLCEFDNRVFFSGNENLPNVVFHTELNDPRYVADLNYYTEGTDLTSVKALVPGNDALFVFKEPNQANTTVFYHRPVIDSEYGKVYPSSHSNISTGCSSTGVNFNDDIVFFSNRGLEAITGDLGSEQVLSQRSGLVDSKLTNESEYKNMKIVEYKGYLMCLVGGKVYLADSRQINLETGYEWYYWELPFEIDYMMAKDQLFLGNKYGQIFVLDGQTDNLQDINSVWTTPKDDFGTSSYQKTSNKRGGVAEVKTLGNNNITIKCKTNKDAEQTMGVYSDAKGYIVYNIKKKKWIDIQISFSSNKPFGLFSCTLEAFKGGYIKR